MKKIFLFLLASTFITASSFAQTEHKQHHKHHKHHKHDKEHGKGKKDKMKDHK